MTTINVTLQELEELFIQDGQGLPRVSPMGAALLLRLHAGGVFEFCDKARGTSANVELARYAHSLPALLQRQAEMEETRRWQQEMVEHLERLSPGQFSYELLNRIFHRHKGRGPATLEVGGLGHQALSVHGQHEKREPACALPGEIPRATTRN